MKRGMTMIIAGLLLAITGTVHAGIVSNLVQDAGFDTISGTEPNSGTAPWFTANEAQNGSLQTVTLNGRGTGQAAKWQFTYDTCSLVQNLSNTVTARLLKFNRLQ